MKRLLPCRTWVSGGLLALALLGAPSRELSRPVAWAAVAAKPYNHALDSALGEAIVAGQLTQVQRLLQQGADPNAKTTDDSLTPMLCLAASVGEPVDTIRALIAAGADVEAGNVRGDAPLVVAALKGQLGAAKLLLQSGAKVDASQDGGRTALMFAAATGHTEVVQALIGKGANVNARAADTATPLIYGASKTAAGTGNLAIARLLVEAGADVSVTLPNGKSAHAQAQANGLQDIADYIDTIDKRDRTLLDAATKGDWTAMKAALAQGANPRYEPQLFEAEGDDTGSAMTPAMWLRSDTAGFDEAVARQILARSDLEAHERTGTTSGGTALILAIEHRDLVMTQLLLKAGANPNTMAFDLDASPLMVAAEIDNLPLVHLLVAAGADKAIKNKKGETALALTHSKAVSDFLQAPPPR